MVFHAKTGSRDYAFDGGDGNDQVTAPNVTNGWRVSDVDGGTLAAHGIGTLSFSNTENLLGGTGIDAFAFGSDGAISGSINGGGGSDGVSLGDFVHFDGTIVFTTKPDVATTFNDGSSATLRLITIGLSSGAAFFGVNYGQLRQTGFIATITKRSAPCTSWVERSPRTTSSTT